MLLTSALLLASACGDDDGTKPALDASIVSDAGTTPTGDGGVGADAGTPDCYPTPKTYLELINACTDAEKVTRNPVLPLLLIDGGLPPLP